MGPCKIRSVVESTRMRVYESCWFPYWLCCWWSLCGIPISECKRVSLSVRLRFGFENR